MIVIDASAAVLGLLNDGEARSKLAGEAVVTPYLADSEIVNALRSQVLRGDVDESDARRAIGVWGRLGVQRVGVSGLLIRMWDLRANLTAYDATYVTVAETIDAALVTADGRLAQAPGPRCTITVVRS